MTFGYLVGEVVRRISGKSLGTFFADEVAGPLGLNAWIGLPEEQEAEGGPDRVHRTVDPGGADRRDDRDHRARRRHGHRVDPGRVGRGLGPGRAGVLGGAFDPTSDYFNAQRAYRAAEIPAANMLTDARSMARMYAATVSDVDGVRLLDPATVERAIEVQTDKTRMHGLPADLDIPADRSFYMSLGFWRSCPPLPMARAELVRPPGLRRIDRLRATPMPSVGFGYVMNLWSFRRRTAGAQPDRCGPGVPRMTDSPGRRCAPHLLPGVIRKQLTGRGQ